MAGLNPGARLQDQAIGRRADPPAMVDDAEGMMRRNVERFRSSGRSFAADNLEHYLDGGGRPRQIDDAEVERHQPILDAERENRRRLRGSLLGDTDKPNIRLGLDRLRSGKTRDGEWMDLGKERWDRDYGTLDSIRQWLIPDDNVVNRARKWLFGDDNRGDDDFAVAVGSAQIGLGAKLQGRRNGNELEFRGTTLHAPVHKETVAGETVRRASEPYNFNPGQPGARQAGILERAGRATPYFLQWLRPERFVAKQRQMDDGTWEYSEEPRWQRSDPADIDDPDEFFED